MVLIYNYNNVIVAHWYFHHKGFQIIKEINIFIDLDKAKTKVADKTAMPLNQTYLH